MIINIGKFKGTQHRTIKGTHDLSILDNYPPVGVSLLNYSLPHTLKHQVQGKLRPNLHTPHIRWFDLLEGSPPNINPKVY